MSANPGRVMVNIERHGYVRSKRVLDPRFDRRSDELIILHKSLLSARDPYSCSQPYSPNSLMSMVMSKMNLTNVGNSQMNKNMKKVLDGYADLSIGVQFYEFDLQTAKV